MCEMFFPKTWIICRVCLNQKDEMFDLFDDTIHKNIWLLLRDCSGLPIRKGDDFPDKICEACLNRLWDAMNFRMDCQRSHRELLQKQMERNVFLYEEEIEKEFLKMSKPNSLKSTTAKEDLDISANILPDQYIDPSKLINIQPPVQPNQIPDETKNQSAVTTNNNEILSHDVKEYCVVKRNPRKINSKVSHKAPAKQPIVLLLRLKNASYEENQTEAIKTEAEGETHRNLNGKTNNVKLKRNNTLKKKYKTLKKLNVKSKLRKRKIQHTCKVCKRTYKTKELLRHHSYIHKRPLECKICHKKFSQIQSLISHNNYHSGIKPYYCRFCLETFSDICNRNAHERQRHENKQFKCNKCDKSFRLLALLRKHAQAHRPKKCFICDKEFYSLQMVRIHHQRKHLKVLHT